MSPIDELMLGSTIVYGYRSGAQSYYIEINDSYNTFTSIWGTITGKNYLVVRRIIPSMRLRKLLCRI